MVAINKILFTGALAAAVSAAPFASTTDIAVPKSNQVVSNSDSDALLQIEALVAGEPLTKRADGGISSLTVLLQQTGSFLSDTIKNLLTLNIPGESDSVVKLLVNVNQLLINIEDDLKSYTPVTGLGGLLQTILVQSGLQSLILGLSSIISILVSSLLKGGKPDPAVIAQIQEIQNHITNISNSSQSQGLLGGLTNLITDLLKSVENLLNSLLNGK